MMVASNRRPFTLTVPVSARLPTSIKPTSLARPR